MADKTAIEWTDATWNPITGCAIVSPGCTNCYAMRLAGTRLRHTPSRASLTVDTKAGPVWNDQVRLNEQWLDQPLRWKRPRRIFVCAHGDLFAENVPDEWIDSVFAVMALAPQHTFQVLTKRAARMREYVSGVSDVRRVTLPNGGIYRFGPWAHVDTPLPGTGIGKRWPLPNVWLGVSAERQQEADQRIPELLATPAAIRFVSAEPLLGPIDFTRIDAGETGSWNTLLRAERRSREPIMDRASTPGTGLDWIIVGGESGPDARPMHPAWARSIRDQCAAAGVPFFFKQWGSWAPVCAMSEEAIDAAYHPAPARDPEAIRRCRVNKHVLHVDGSQHDPRERGAFQQGTGAMTMLAIGKKAAGRRLDGIEHNDMPEVLEVAFR